MSRPGSGRAARLFKAGCDPLVAAVSLAMLSPLLLAIAVAIKLDSRGPLFFYQDRVGRDERVFRLVKFRSMIPGADQVGLGMKVTCGDSRITRVGSWLRRLSLDELPQLINIARGDMSVVGPRPTFPAQAARYTPRQRRRLSVRPGLTGWAQVHGRNSLSWPERIEYDLWYVENWSILLDFRIVLKTPAAVLSSEGLYGKDGVTRDLEDE
jgi:lipopolysaccharide/colanic/teichoic acid biosynthesis glycosyltransferase